MEIRDTVAVELNRKGGKDGEMGCVTTIRMHPLLFLLGFYCPMESSTPLPCPKGTYGPTADAVSVDSCLQCPPHHYCPRPGLSTSLLCGPVAQQPLSGQVTCICPGEGQSFQVTVSSHDSSIDPVVPVVCLCDFVVFIQHHQWPTSFFVLWAPPLFYKPNE